MTTETENTNNQKLHPAAGASSPQGGLSDKTANRLAELKAALRYEAVLHHRSGGITEIMGAGDGGIYSGFYDVGEEDKMAEAILAFDGKLNLYHSANAVDKSLRMS